MSSTLSNQPPTRFTYVTVENGTSIALDSITVPMTEGLGWPTQGHIALTSNDDEMMVTYVTGTDTTPSVKFDEISWGSVFLTLLIGMDWIRTT